MITINKNIQTLNENKINTNTLICQIACLVIMLLAYVISKWLGLVAGIIGAGYIMSNTTWVNRLSFLFFLFPFASVFKLDTEATSLFMIFRIFVLLAVLLYDIKKLMPKILVSAMVFIIYSLIISMDNDMHFLTRLLNIILWSMIIYVMQITITERQTLPITRSLTNGFIIACILALNMDWIPGIEEAIRVKGFTMLTGESVDRFSALFGDPNHFIVVATTCLWAVYMEFKNGYMSVSEFLIRALILTAFAILSISKSCIIALGIYWIYVLFSQNNIKATHKAGILLVALVAVIYYVYTNPDVINLFTYRLERHSVGNSKLDDLTTGRYTIWRTYVSYMISSNTWIFGNGLASLVPNGRAAHNVLVQVVFHLGIVGFALYFTMLKNMFKSIPENVKRIGTDRAGVAALISFIILGMFLDLIYLEFTYFCLAIMFVYMKKTKELTDEEYNRKIHGAYYDVLNKHNDN